MPIYQYKCIDCQHQLERMQKMNDPLLEICPACNAPTLRKQLTAARFKLNGTGWYATDFKNSGAKPAPKKANDTDNTSASGGDKSSGSALESSKSTSE